MKPWWIVRIRFDSHSLWILNRFIDFPNNFCVRVRVLDRTVQTGCRFTWFWIMQWFSVKGDEVKTLPELCLKVWSCFFDPWLRIFAGKNRFHFFLSPSGLDSVKSFASSLFFSFSDSVIGAGVPRLRWGIRTLNCRGINSVMKIHQWISENWWVCDEFVMNFDSGKLGFMHLFFVLDEFSVLILTVKRENEKSVCVMWRVISGFLLTCTVVAFYRLPCVYLDQLERAIWPWTACVASWTKL